MQVLVATGTAIALAVTVAQAPQLIAQQLNAQYTVEDYGAITGTTTVLRGINNNREIAGSFRRPGSPDVTDAVVGGQQSQQEVATGRDGTLGIAYDINDNGDVVGAVNGDVAVRPIRSNRANGVRELPLLGKDTGGLAYAINTAGEAVGSSTGPGGRRAVWWDGPGNAVAALPGTGGKTSQALDINDRGDVVGTIGDKRRQATLWPAKGAPVALPTLPGYDGAEAVGVNEGGTVVGFATGGKSGSGGSRAVLWSAGGATATDLGTLAGGTDSRARSVSPDGHVVGVSGSGGGDRAFVWTAATGMVDLNTVAPAGDLVLVDAVDINRNGDILAMGYEPDGASGSHVHAAHERPRRVMVLVPTR